MKILNLYAGIGGNRKLWGDEHEITAVEYNEAIADVYADLYPDDELIIDDAHQYLLDHYKEYDFIWSSPPCQTHSSFRHNINVRFRGTPAKYPDMTLYEEIVFLQYYAGDNIKWVVENVKPYYGALIPATQLERHLFWSNFDIPIKTYPKDLIRKAQIPDLQKKYGIDLTGYGISNKRQVLRNCVEPQIGLDILTAVTDLKTTPPIQLYERKGGVQ